MDVLKLIDSGANGEVSYSEIRARKLKREAHDDPRGHSDNFN